MELDLLDHVGHLRVVIHGRQLVDAPENPMPLQQSSMVPLGTKMPAFALPDVVSRGTIASDTLGTGRPLLVLFICAHCPFTRYLEPAIRALSPDYGDRVQLVAISANDPEQVPDDSIEGLARLALALELRGPFCYDASQATARAFGAECTPECFLYDTARTLVYRGQIDAGRPGSGIAPTAAPLRRALDALLRGMPIDADQRPGLGCNIKWRAAAARPGVATR